MDKDRDMSKDLEKTSVDWIIWAQCLFLTTTAEKKKNDIAW